MPYVLMIPEQLKAAGWKVRIYDFERLEPPHATICCRTRTWRLNLRDGTFLDKRDKWSQIDKAVRTVIEENWQHLCDEWDAIHSDNPVQGQTDDDES